MARLVGVEAEPVAEHPNGHPAFDRWIRASLSEDIRLEETFDVILAADVLEHLPRPELLLPQIGRWLKPDGLFIASLPNVANITVRLQVAAGHFPYADRGILDRTHLRFFTRRSARQLIEDGEFRIEKISATAMPVELAVAAARRPFFRGPVRRAASAFSAAWPTLFGYQFIIEARHR